MRTPPRSGTYKPVTRRLAELVITVGIAVTASILLVAAGAVFERSQARAARANRPGAIPAQHPTHIDEVRDLMLR